MDDIVELLEKNVIAISFTKLDSFGFYVPKLKTTFVNDSISLIEQKKEFYMKTNMQLITPLFMNCTKKLFFT